MRLQIQSVSGAGTGIGSTSESKQPLSRESLFPARVHRASVEKMKMKIAERDEPEICTSNNNAFVSLTTTEGGSSARSGRRAVGWLKKPRRNSCGLLRRGKISARVKGC